MPGLIKCGWAALPSGALPLDAALHTLDPLLPLPQVRAYWNVKGDVRSGAWQGIMRGYYAASLLTQRQVGSRRSRAARLGQRWPTCLLVRGRRCAQHKPGSCY